MSCFEIRLLIRIYELILENEVYREEIIEKCEDSTINSVELFTL